MVVILECDDLGTVLVGDVSYELKLAAGLQMSEFKCSNEVLRGSSNNRASRVES